MEQSLLSTSGMESPRLPPEIRFSLLMLVVAILIILSIMNKWI
jgi:hypothetical protein